MRYTRSRFFLTAHVKLLGLVASVFAIGSGHAFSAPDSPPQPGQASGPRIVMIIRHAEKPAASTSGEKDPNLSKRGYERAEALAKVIPERFPKPDFLIATKRSKNSNRPVETITPLADVLHETIEATCKDKEYDQLAHTLLTDLKYAGKVVLIAWHHGKIPELAKALGANDVPAKWEDGVFDRVWEITYKNGVAAFADLPENALPDDSSTPGDAKSGAKSPKAVSSK
jgi:phosphohistidine phosphatase SixA